MKNTIQILRARLFHRTWTLQIKWEPRDIWIGLYWEGGKLEAIPIVAYRFFLCVIPMIPVILTMQRSNIGEHLKAKASTTERRNDV